MFRSGWIWDYVQGAAGNPFRFPPTVFFQIAGFMHCLPEWGREGHFSDSRLGVLDFTCRNIVLHPVCEKSTNCCNKQKYQPVYNGF